MIGIYDFTFASDGPMWMQKQSLPIFRMCFKMKEENAERNALTSRMWLRFVRWFVTHSILINHGRKAPLLKKSFHFLFNVTHRWPLQSLITRATDALAGLLFFLPVILKFESPFPFDWLRFHGNLQANQDIVSLFNVCMSPIEPCALVACAN